MRRSSPVQQWLDSLPADNSGEAQKPEADTQTAESHKETDSQDTVVVTPDNKVCEENNLEVPCSSAAWKRKSLESGLLPSTLHSGSVRKRLQRDHSIQSEGCSPKFKNPLLRDYSLQSDASGSSGSSVLNVLGARKVDAESVLLAMGFGPSEKQQRLQRIPDRFLAPSKLKGISTEQFIKNEQHSMRMHDCGVFGYRGLTGNPHAQPSTIVAKIMECILHGDVCREHALARTRHSIADPSAHVNFTSRLPND